MSDKEKFVMQCTDFDVLLTDALDGLLEGERLAKFERHKAECAACGVLYAETKSGFEWMHTLEEVDPPINLVHNIVAVTSGAQADAMLPAIPKKTFMDRMKEAFVPRISGVMTPRFAMSFGMAFFSLSMLMSVAGVHPGDLRHMDLTPKGLRKSYYETQARATRYYENIRLVYQIESQLRQLKKAADTPAEKKTESKPESKQNQSKDPERREQNYSRQQGDQLVAEVLRVDGKIRA